MKMERWYCSIPAGWYLYSKYSTVMLRLILDLFCKMVTVGLSVLEEDLP